MTGSIGGGRLDPHGLIAEAYRIDGITSAECRSIFFDWAIGFEGRAEEAAPKLFATYSADFPNHPMTVVLEQGSVSPDRIPVRTGRRRR